MSKLTDRLDATLGVGNAHLFADRGDANVWISYDIHHPHALGRQYRRATVFYKVGGTWKRREFQVHGKDHVETRRLSVEAAQAAASERFGVTEWVAGPFRDSWMPREVRDRVMTKLKAAEAAEGSRA